MKAATALALMLAAITAQAEVLVIVNIMPDEAVHARCPLPEDWWGCVDWLPDINNPEVWACKILIPRSQDELERAATEARLRPRCVPGA